MKWLRLLLIKIGAIALTTFSLYFFLFSPITLEIHDIHSLAKNEIDEMVKESGDPNLGSGLLIAKETGIEGQAIASLPSKMTFSRSYADLYSMSRDYQTENKLTAQEIGLTSHNKIQALLNNYLLKEINHGLQQNKEQVSTGIRTYQNVFLGVAALYLLTVLLIIFGRPLAVLPLLIASVASFGATWLICQTGNQSELASNLRLSFASGFWAALVLALVIVVMWPLLLKKAKRKQMRHA